MMGRQIDAPSEPASRPGGVVLAQESRGYCIGSAKADFAKRISAGIHSRLGPSNFCPTVLPELGHS
jgi:hypothetical protein